MELTPEQKLVNQYLASMVAIGLESGATSMANASSQDATMVLMMRKLAQRFNECAEKGMSFKLEVNGDKIIYSDSSGVSFSYDYPSLPNIVLANG